MSIQVETAASDPKWRPWGLVVLAVAVVGAIGLISQGIDTAATGSTGTTVASIDEGRLDDRVPGFTGTLHVILTINGVPTYARWSADAIRPELVELDTPGMQLNTDLTQVGTINFIGARTADLRVGLPGQARALTPDVTAFAWHDSDPIRIAVTRTLDDTSLWVVEVDPNAPLLVSSFRDLESGQEVVAYGEWGFALRTGPDSDGLRIAVILDPNGEETFRMLGDVVGSIPGGTGGVLIADRLSANLTSTWTSDQPSIDTIVDPERIIAAIWNTDLTSYAELSNGNRPGIDVLYVRRGDDPIFLFENYEPIAWDLSGRFLAATRSRTLVLIDATDGEIYELGFPLATISDARFGS